MRHPLAACSVALLLTCPIAAFAQDVVSPAPPPTPHRRAADQAHPSLSAIVKALRHDFAGTVSAGNLALMAAGGSGALGAHSVDRRVAQARWGEGGFFTPGDLVGSALVQSSAAAATYVAGRVFDAPRVSYLGADLIRAQIVSQTLTQGIKFTTTRTRPDGTSLSLPSGHTSSAFATATVLRSHFGWKVGAPAYAVAAWVGASRVQMKRHFVSDVIAGAAIGLVAGRSVTVGRGDMRFALVPTAAPGGAGVNFVLVGSR